MKNINIAKNIANLRKKKGLTQDQLAQELSVSAQAISKWETNASLPDIQMLPVIAEYFAVSVDYLFYGQNYVYDDIYDKVFNKICSYPQMCKDSYEKAHKFISYAHHGICRGGLRGRGVIYDTPSHISNENGVSLISGKGYGAIITRRFFENISSSTADLSTSLLSALSDRNAFIVCMAIISMSDISYGELQESLKFSDKELRTALDILISSKLVIEKSSKHKSLGLTYDINEKYHSCLCILMATIEMQRYTLEDYSCCMGYGDYPISI